MSPTAPVQEPVPSDTDATAGSDFALVRDFAGFCLRAPIRHRRLSLGVFLAVAVISLAAAFLMPRSYVVNTKILGQRNLVMPSLGNPRRSVPSDSDAPTRAARDVILGRDNLVAIIKETDLLARWSAERHPLLRVKDRVYEIARGPLSEEDRLRALVGVLEKRLQVQADDSTIRISIEWPSAETAFRIVSCAERNFLEGRKAAEVAVIADTIEILKAEADRQREAVDAAFSRVVDLRRDAGDAPRLPRVTAAVAAPGPKTEVVTVPLPPAPEERQIASRLDEKRRAIRAIEEPRQQRIAQLEADLSRLRTSYNAAHPAVLQAEADLVAARLEPPQLAELRQEERDLVARLADLPGGERRVTRTVPRARGESSGASVVVDASPHEDEPELATAKTKLTAATHKYEDLMDRVDAARIELHTAQAAFKYRYTVVDPPEVPKEAKRPNRALLISFGVVLGALLGVFAAAARDLAGGRFLEAWQVRRRLALPVLAEIEVP
jgi:uncharacterized protein involved in exopolysaccharide biosynthesis